MNATLAEKQKLNKIEELTRRAVYAALDVLDEEFVRPPHKRARGEWPIGDALAYDLHARIERAIEEQMRDLF